MDRKVSVMVCVLALIFGFAVTAQAATHTVYDGNPSSTYINYFRDIVAGLSLHDNYLAFRSGQNEYMLITGDLQYDGNTFTLLDTGTVYTFISDNNYNASLSYQVGTITSFALNPEDKLIYSDLGQFPQLEERGTKYEIISALLVGVGLLGLVIGRFFRVR